MPDLIRHQPSLAGRDVEAAGLVMTGALLPKNYQLACTALAGLVQIDECKEWADRAEALRSYARQADDPTLLNHSMRIKARAVRRCGELLQEIPAASGGDRRGPTGGHPPIGITTRSQAASAAGLSDHQRKTALRVANVPKAEFDAAVDVANPATVTQLAQAGRKQQLMPDTGDDEDHLSHREADESVKFIARRLDTPFLDPSPGIRACICEAMKRASAEDVKLISGAAEFLTSLTKVAQ